MITLTDAAAVRGRLLDAARGDDHLDIRGLRAEPRGREGGEHGGERDAVVMSDALPMSIREGPKKAPDGASQVRTSPDSFFAKECRRHSAAASMRLERIVFWLPGPPPAPSRRRDSGNSG